MQSFLNDCCEIYTQVTQCVKTDTYSDNDDEMNMFKPCKMYENFDLESQNTIIAWIAIKIQMLIQIPVALFCLIEGKQPLVQQITVYVLV